MSGKPYLHKVLQLIVNGLDDNPLSSGSLSDKHINAPFMLFFYRVKQLSF